MEVPDSYRERFAESGWRVLEHAMKRAVRGHLNYVSVEHLIAALSAVEADLFDAALLDLAIDGREVKNWLDKRIKAGLQHRGAGVRLAPEVNRYLKRAWKRASRVPEPKIESTDILVVLAEDRRGLFVELLRSFGAEATDVTWKVLHRGAAAEWQRAHNMELLYMRFTGRQKDSDYAAGDTVRIKTGPFASFTGKVEEVFKEASKLKVLVHIFGRAAAVELAFRDAEKLTFAQDH